MTTHARSQHVSTASTDRQHDEIFIFPLGTVLFPGGMLPLKIFEQRYIEMTKACLRDERPSASA